MARLAVVLFNLGGPDSPAAIQPFLFNLFNDPAIIAAPGPLRWLLAQFISRRRVPVARAIYAHLGGKSPLLELTRQQASALHDRMSERADVKVFVCMRYWHPMSDEVTAAVKDFGPDEVIALPLYPQYSTTTTGSSLADWKRAAHRTGLTVPTRTVCCYPLAPHWLTAQVALLREALAHSGAGARVLFSAHGLPKKIIARGDPYQWQVEQTAVGVVDALGEELDWAVCYQSRVGPLEWIGPSTEQELARAGIDGVEVVIVPIAFVSEHSETLVELDIEYREVAAKYGVPKYTRVPAVGSHPEFIAALADLVDAVIGKDRAAPYGGTAGRRLCPQTLSGCPCKMADGEDAA